jgi:hypothetical protein
MDIENDPKAFRVYYSHTIRVIFLVAGALMIIGLPFFNTLISMPIAISILAILALGIFSGYQNQNHKGVVWFNTGISIFAFLIFTYYAVYTYMNLPPNEARNVYFFWINEALALLFFLSVYLNIKALLNIMDSSTKKFNKPTTEKESE